MNHLKKKANSSALQPDNSRAGIYQPLPALPVQSLKTKSEQRILNDTYFKTIDEFSKWMQDYKAGKTVPLQWKGYAAQYKKTRDMFKQLSKDDEVSNVVKVSNNGFDNLRINLSNRHSKDINETYLKHVQKDLIVAEAYKIMMDWISK